MSDPFVYLDNNSTTRIDPRVFEAMVPFLTDQYGNAASSTHEMGRLAKDAVESARQQLADAINATPAEIVFTSGATESNNLAIRGVCTHRSAKNKSVLTSALEHRAVLDPIRRLEKEDFDVAVLTEFDRNGLISTDELAHQLQKPFDLVSLMLANNEIGSVLTADAIAALHTYSTGKRHCDAAQALGKIKIDVQELPFDLISLSAHKLHGPKGAGALYIRHGTRLKPIVDGGGHEKGKRSGTLNVPGIVGFGQAAKLATNNLDESQDLIDGLTRFFFESLTASVDGVHLNGPMLVQHPNSGGIDANSKNTNSKSPLPSRLPGNLNLTFDGIDAETLTLQMPRICISTGSACTSADPEPSHVLKAIGLNEMESRASIRIGISRFTTRDEINLAVNEIIANVKKLRSLNG